MKYFIDTEFIEGLRKPISWLPTIGNFNKPYHSIQLISIGLVSGDGREYYAMSNEFNYNDASDWVKENVIDKMKWWADGVLLAHGVYTAGEYVYGYGAAKVFGKSNKQIAQEIVEFTNPNIAGLKSSLVGRIFDKELTDDTIKWNKYIIDHDVHLEKFPSISNIYTRPEFYAYYADYDWVLFCSLFGTMMDLPKGFPMYCKDLKQMFDEKAAMFHKNDFFTAFDFTGKDNTDISNEQKIEHLKKHVAYPSQTNEHHALEDAKWNKELYGFLKTI